MFCENCRYEMSESATFCPSCGQGQTSAVHRLALIPSVGVSYPLPSGAVYGATYPSSVSTSTSMTTNGMAVASLVLGILWIFGLGSLLALIFGVVGNGQIKKSHGTQSGRGLAIAGVVLGAVGVASSILWIIFVVAVIHQANTCDPSIQYC